MSPGRSETIPSLLAASLAIVLVAPLLPACSGTVGAPGAPGEPGAPGPGTGGTVPGGPGATPAIGAGNVQLRRLNLVEYQATIKDWLGITVDVSDFPPDGATNSGFDTVSSVLAISQLHVASFEQAASAVVDTLFATDPGGVRAKWCSYASGNGAADEACASQIVSDFAEQAWRRPHGSWGGNEGLLTYQAALKSTGRFGTFPLEVRLQQVLKSVLLGPRFLLRVEMTDAKGRLDVPSVASRLSYMLWGSAPDVKSLKSNLLDDTALRTEFSRMRLDGTKSQRMLERFSDIWLQLGQVPKLNRDVKAFPKFSPGLLTAMHQETSAFFRSFAGMDNAQALPLRKLLTQTTAPTDPTLKALYGNSPRTGVLTQGAILAVTSTDSGTSAVRRGKWVMERLLCEAPPPPPENLSDKIKEQQVAADQTASERVRLAQHRADPLCNVCHQTMDVIGLGLENYDAIGEYRTIDPNNHLIDPSGTLPGSTQKFSDAAQLATTLSEDPRVLNCMAQQLLTYGTGREYSGADSALLDSIVKAAGGTEATFQRTLEAVVLSPAFRSREGNNQ